MASMYLEFAGEVDIDDLVAVVSDVEFFVRPNVETVSIIAMFANDSPYGQIVNVHLEERWRERYRKRGGWV